MYHPNSYDLAQTRIADLRRRAHRDARARAARGPGRRRLPGLRPAAEWSAQQTSTDDLRHENR
jgi:hypothetical protein